MAQDTAPQGVEESVKELLERIHFNLTSSEISEDTIKQLDEIKEKAQDLLKQTIIDNVDSVFKKEFLKLLAKGSTSKVDINKILEILNRIENNEAQKNLVSYIMSLSEQIEAHENIYEIEFNFNFSFVYNKHKYLLTLAKAYYSKDRDRLTTIIGNYDNPVFRLSENEENNKNTLADQIKGILSLIEEFRKQINEAFEEEAEYS